MTYRRAVIALLVVVATGLIATLALPVERWRTGRMPVMPLTISPDAIL